MLRTHESRVDEIRALQVAHREERERLRLRDSIRAQQLALRDSFVSEGGNVGRVPPGGGHSAPPRRRASLDFRRSLDRIRHYNPFEDVDKVNALWREYGRAEIGGRGKQPAATPPPTPLDTLSACQAEVDSLLRESAPVAAPQPAASTDDALLLDARAELREERAAREELERRLRQRESERADAAAFGARERADAAAFGAEAAAQNRAEASLHAATLARLQQEVAALYQKTARGGAARADATDSSSTDVSVPRRRRGRRDRGVAGMSVADLVTLVRSAVPQPAPVCGCQAGAKAAGELRLEMLERQLAAELREAARERECAREREHERELRERDRRDRWMEGRLLSTELHVQQQRAARPVLQQSVAAPVPAAEVAYPAHPAPAPHAAQQPRSPPVSPVNVTQRDGKRPDTSGIAEAAAAMRELAEHPPPAPVDPLELRLRQVGDAVAAEQDDVAARLSAVSAGLAGARFPHGMPMLSEIDEGVVLEMVQDVVDFVAQGSGDFESFSLHSFRPKWGFPAQCISAYSGYTERTAAAYGAVEARLRSAPEATEADTQSTFSIEGTTAVGTPAVVAAAAPNLREVEQRVLRREEAERREVEAEESPARLRCQLSAARGLEAARRAERLRAEDRRAAELSLRRMAAAELLSLEDSEFCARAEVEELEEVGASAVARGAAEGLKVLVRRSAQQDALRRQREEQQAAAEQQRQQLALRLEEQQQREAAEAAAARREEEEEGERLAAQRREEAAEQEQAAAAMEAERVRAAEQRRQEQAAAQARADAAAAEQLRQEQAAAAEAAAEQLRQEQAAAERARQEQAAAEQLRQEQAAAERVRREQAAAEQARADAAAAEQAQAAAAKAAAEQLRQEQAAEEQLRQEQAAAALQQAHADAEDVPDAAASAGGGGGADDLLQYARPSDSDYSSDEVRRRRLKRKKQSAAKRADRPPVRALAARSALGGVLGMRRQTSASTIAQSGVPPRRGAGKRAPLSFPGPAAAGDPYDPQPSEGGDTGPRGSAESSSSDDSVQAGILAKLRTSRAPPALVAARAVGSDVSSGPPSKLPSRRPSALDAELAEGPPIHFRRPDAGAGRYDDGDTEDEHVPPPAAPWSQPPPAVPSVSPTLGALAHPGVRKVPALSTSMQELIEAYQEKQAGAATDVSSSRARSDDSARNDAELRQRVLELVDRCPDQGGAAENALRATLKHIAAGGGDGTVQAVQDALHEHRARASDDAD